MRMIVRVLKIVAVVVVVLVLVELFFDEDDVPFLRDWARELEAVACIDRAIENLVALSTEFPEWQPSVDRFFQWEDGRPVDREARAAAWLPSKLAEAREMRAKLGTADARRETRRRVELEARARGESPEYQWLRFVANACDDGGAARELDQLRAQRELRGGVGGGQ